MIHEITIETRTDYPSNKKSYRPVCSCGWPFTSYGRRWWDYKSGAVDFGLVHSSRWHDLERFIGEQSDN